MKFMDQVNMVKRQYISLIVWIIVFLSIGWCIGILTQQSVDIWYAALTRSPLTPPNYFFGVAWTILYTLLAVSGCRLWAHTAAPLTLEKILYTIHMILNWSWAPLFFIYHAVGVALVLIGTMIFLTAALIRMIYRSIPLISYLLLPYLGWISFAAYLNWYIWYYN